MSRRICPLRPLQKENQKVPRRKNKGKEVEEDPPFKPAKATEL